MIHGWLKWVMQVLLAVVVSVGLTACSMAPPGNQLIERAIAMQVAETQQELTQELRLNADQPPEFEIGRVVVTEQQPLTIQDLPAFHLQGTYDLTLKLPKRQVTQQQNRFDLYLQRQKEGKSWRIARLLPAHEEQVATWVTQLVQ